MQEYASDWRVEGAEGVPPGATRADVAEYANQVVWHETLVFLMELLAAEQRRILKPTRECLFGTDLSAVPPEHKEATHRVVLLARLAVDPYAWPSAGDAEWTRAIAGCCA